MIFTGKIKLLKIEKRSFKDKNTVKQKEYVTSEFCDELGNKLQATSTQELLDANIQLPQDVVAEFDVTSKIVGLVTYPKLKLIAVK